MARNSDPFPNVAPWDGANTAGAPQARLWRVRMLPNQIGTNTHQPEAQALSVLIPHLDRLASLPSVSRREQKIVRSYR